MNLHHYAVGERVTVINSTLSGTFFIEGQATIVRSMKGYAMYLVRFDGEDALVTRFVDPTAQADPGAAVDRLNDPDPSGQQDERA